MPLTIRQAKTEHDRARVFHFRYKIYVQEMQRRQTYADHAACTVREPLDETGHLFLAEDATGSIVGTLRTNFGRDTDFGICRELYGLECVGRWFPQQVSVSTKFMVAPQYRKSTLGVRIASQCYQFGLQQGILFDFIDCNPHHSTEDIKHANLIKALIEETVQRYPEAERSIREGLDRFLAVYPIPVWNAAYERTLAGE